MKLSRYLLSALAGFVVFGPLSFAWHVLLFHPYYYNPATSVKNSGDLNIPFLVSSLAVLVLGMTYFVIKSASADNGKTKGVFLGALFASIAIDFHSILLIGLYTNLDPYYVYYLDAGWAIVVGGLAGWAIAATYNKLNAGASSQSM